MTGIPVLLSILAVLGKILLGIVLGFLVLILLILLVPIRYCVSGSLEDPNPHEQVDQETTQQLIQRSYADVRLSWLLHLVRVSYRYPECPELTVNVLFWRIPIGSKEKSSKPASSGKQKGRKKKEKKPPIQWGQILKLLQQSETKCAIRVILEQGGHTLRSLLPKRWELTGTAGLGGPEGTASFMEIQALLYPFVCGHVWIEPQMEGYQFDLKGSASGRICLGHVLAALLIMLLNTEVRGLIADVQRIAGGQ